MEEKKKTNRSSTTRKLTESAMLLAVAIVLEFLAKMLIPSLPYGGQITVASMLPVVLIAYRHGTKWGFVSALTYALLETAIGMKNVSAAFMPGYFGDGVMILKAIVMCLLDYILAFTVLGLGGIFRNRIKKPGLGLMCGSIVALFGRFVCHVLSGYILFSGWAEWFFTQDGFPAWGARLVESLNPALLGWAYSLVYNGMFMIPEILITAVVALLISRIPKVVIKVN